MLIVDKPFEKGVILSVKETRIDMSISRKFREQVSKFLEKKPAVVVFDMHDTEYLDSSRPPARPAARGGATARVR